MLREGGTKSFEVALMLGTYVLDIQKWGGGVQSVFTPLKRDMRSFTLSRGRMQKVLNPQFSIGFVALPPHN